MPQKYCTNCGLNLDPKANFCSKCGTARHGKNESEKGNTEKEQTPAEKPTKTIGKRRLCPRAVWSFYISYLAKTSALLLLFALGAVFEPLLFSPMLGAYIIILYIAAVIVHQNYYFEISDNAFRKEHGVIHKNDVTIPFNRIQNVNITRSLSDRMLGLARVDIETAGSSASLRRNVGGGSMTKAEGHLPGVTMAQAKEIHDLLVVRFSDIKNHVNTTSP